MKKRNDTAIRAFRHDLHFFLEELWPSLSLCILLKFFEDFFSLERDDFFSSLRPFDRTLSQFEDSLSESESMSWEDFLLLCFDFLDFFLDFLLFLDSFRFLESPSSLLDSEVDLSSNC